MGNLFQKHKIYEIDDGLLGVKRDIFLKIIRFLSLGDDRKMVGISSQCVEWISHSNYTFLRRAGFNVKNAQLMLFQNNGEKNVQITPINLHYEAAFLSSRPAFLNLRIKQTILEFSLEVSYDDTVFQRSLCIGVATPSQLSSSAKEYIGNFNCGAGLMIRPWELYFRCNGKYSRHLKDGGMRDGSFLKGVINNCYKNNGKMYFIVTKEIMHHALVNLPFNGVYLGFSSWNNYYTVKTLTLTKHRFPPSEFLNTNFIAHDFNGDFESFSYNMRNEEGNVIPNPEYYFE